MKWQLKRAENNLRFDDSRMTNTRIFNPCLCKRERVKEGSKTVTKQFTKKLFAHSVSPKLFLGMRKSYPHPVKIFFLSFVKVKKYVWSRQYYCIMLNSVLHKTGICFFSYYNHPKFYVLLVYDKKL